MTTDTAPTSFENAPSLIEWNSLSEEDKIKQQEEMTKFLDEPDTLTKFSEACRNIGQTAVALDHDFRVVQKGFAELVKKYGKDFPDVGKVYAPKWDGFMARWNGESGILWSSRKLAAETAASLTDYGLNLELIADIKDTKDLKDAQNELKDYVQKHPIHVATIVADGFKVLKNDIQDFSKEFSKYLEDENQRLTNDAKQYEVDIKKYQQEISQLNDKLKAAVVALGVSFAVGIVESLIPLVTLFVLLAKRLLAQQKLNQAKVGLAKTVSKQKALAAMQADFEKFKPNIDDICAKLGVFADIWTFATEQSAAMNAELKGGMEILKRKEFQVKLALLTAQIAPLREGMRQYATQIMSPPKSSHE